MIHTQHSKSVERIVARFVTQLTKVVAREVEARSRVLASEHLAVAFAAPGMSAKSKATEQGPGMPSRRASDERSPEQASPDVPRNRSDRHDTNQADAGSVTRAPRARRPRAVAETPRHSPAVDPEQAARDAELARLRSLLRPTRPEGLFTDPALASSAAAVPLDAPQAEPLRLLEDEIREQVHALGQVGTARCTARIAAWAGRVRAYEEESGNRMAARLMMEKLRALAYAMEAGPIEALVASWRTGDWGYYVRKNEELAEAPPPPAPAPAEAPPESSADSTPDAVVDGSDYSAAWS